MSFIERMEVELKELEIKVKGCGDFLGKELRGESNFLDKEDVALMSAQHQAMVAYKVALNSRLEKAKKNAVQEGK